VRQRGVGHAYHGQRQPLAIKPTAAVSGQPSPRRFKCKGAARRTEASSNPLTLCLGKQLATMEESCERQCPLLFSCSDNMLYSMDLSASKLAGQERALSYAPTSSNQLTGSESERAQNNASHGTKDASKQKISNRVTECNRNCRIVRFSIRRSVRPQQYAVRASPSSRLRLGESAKNGEARERGAARRRDYAWTGL